MDPVASTIQSGHVNLEKARHLRDQGNQAMGVENFREALRLFHQCILLARAVEQTSSVAIHQNSIIHVDTADVPANLDADPEKQAATEAEKLKEERERQTAQSEGAKNEAHKIMAECYLNLANCVLNGGQRSVDDYLRVIQYCSNVLTYEPTNEQLTNATLFKALAYMKAELYNDAIASFRELPDNEQARQLIEECQRLKLIQRRKRDELIQANFAKQHQNNERNGFPPDRHGMNGSALNGTIN